MLQLQLHGPLANLSQEYEWIEYFAGTGHLTQAMESAQYHSIRFDLLDYERKETRRSNFMNMAHPSGFALLGGQTPYDACQSHLVILMHVQYHLKQLRLATLFLLRAMVDNFGMHLGMKCSSFCKMNVGTSQRAPCASIGYEEYGSVVLGNQLLERRPYIYDCPGFCMMVQKKINRQNNRNLLMYPI